MTEIDPRVIRNVVILTGAGISAESGLATFRDSGGLWEGHDPMEIATPEAFSRNPELVYRFYNARRRQMGDARQTTHTVRLPICNRTILVMYFLSRKM